MLYYLVSFLLFPPKKLFSCVFVFFIVSCRFSKKKKKGFLSIKIVNQKFKS